jgi:hypothetical protein
MICYKNIVVEFYGRAVVIFAGLEQDLSIV